MNNFLRIQFVADTDGTGELIVSARSNGFSGQASAWFGKAELFEFARRLESTYPILASAPITLEGGYGSARPERFSQIQVGLYFLSLGSLGVVRCHVKLSTPALEHYPDEPRFCTELDLGTNYEPLRSFARAFEMVVSGALDEAVLF